METQRRHDRGLALTTAGAKYDAGGSLEGVGYLVKKRRRQVERPALVVQELRVGLDPLLEAQRCLQLRTRRPHCSIVGPRREP
jgi:hypothetical protein